MHSYIQWKGDLVIGQTTSTKRIYKLTEKGTEVIENILKSKEEIFNYTKNIF